MYLHQIEIYHDTKGIWTVHVHAVLVEDLFISIYLDIAFTGQLNRQMVKYLYMDVQLTL